MLPYDRKRAFRKQWLYLGTFLTVIFLTVTNLEMVAEVLRSGRKLSAPIILSFSSSRKLYFESSDGRWDSVVFSPVVHGTVCDRICG